MLLVDVESLGVYRLHAGSVRLRRRSDMPEHFSVNELSGRLKITYGHCR